MLESRLDLTYIYHVIYGSMLGDGNQDCQKVSALIPEDPE